MRQKILQAAVKAAESLPLHTLGRNDIAKRVKCAPSLVTYYLGDAEQIRNAVLVEAIDKENLDALAGALTWGAQVIPAKLRRAAARRLAQ